jgi:hypothetical protein
MKLESAARAKRDLGPDLGKLPHEGTLIRAIFDRFQENRGRPVRVFDIAGRSRGTWFNQLQDFYGLDIRKVSGSGAKGRGAGKGQGFNSYVLVGEWFGSKYVDYVAERLKNENLA